MHSSLLYKKLCPWKLPATIFRKNNIFLFTVVNRKMNMKMYFRGQNRCLKVYLIRATSGIPNLVSGIPDTSGITFN